MFKDEWKIVPKNAQENADYVSASNALGAGTFMLDLSDELSEGNFVNSNGVAPSWTNWEPGDNNKNGYDGKKFTSKDLKK